MSVGCIQAQRCHDDHCPTGVATQNPWLTHGLDPDLKSVRAANYLRAWRREMLKLAEACGVVHPALIRGDMVEILLGHRSSTPLWQQVGYDSPDWGLPSPEQSAALRALMAQAPHGGSAEPSPTAQAHLDRTQVS